MKGYNEIVIEFVKDCRELITILKLFKKQIKIIVPIKEQELAYYKHFVEFLGKYEEINTKNARLHGEFTNDLNVTIMIGDNKKVDLREKIQKLVRFIGNNF